MWTPPAFLLGVISSVILPQDCGELIIQSIPSWDTVKICHNILNSSHHLSHETQEEQRKQNNSTRKVLNSQLSVTHIHLNISITVLDTELLLRSGS